VGNRQSYYCSVCGELGHNSSLHSDARSRSMEAGRLVYEEGLSFAEAGRRVGISRQAAHQGWRRYVRRADLQKT
jgi:transposase-like protein